MSDRTTIVIRDSKIITAVPVVRAIPIIPLTGVVAGVYNNPTIEVGADGRIISAESGGGITGNEIRQILDIESNNQTVFQLSFVVAQPDLSKLFLNGVKAFYGVEYVINSSVLTWSGIGLDISDNLEIIYI